MFDFIKDRIWYIKVTMQNLDVFAFHDDEEAVVTTAPSDTNSPSSERTASDRA